MRHWIATLIIAAPVLAGGPALAQSGPSVDQIIKSLTPTGDVTKAGTRGIRLSPPAETRGVTATTPVATQPNAAGKRAPSAEPAAPTINLTVNFASGSADLTPQAIVVLDKLGAALASDGLLTYRFRIEGNTDTVGTRDFNNSLSGFNGGMYSNGTDVQGLLKSVGAAPINTMPVVPNARNSPYWNAGYKGT